MTDLKERLTDIEHLTEPDLWGEIEHRVVTHPGASGQDPASGSTTGKRVRAGLVAAGVFVLAASFAWAALQLGGNPGTSTPAAVRYSSVEALARAIDEAGLGCANPKAPIGPYIGQALVCGAITIYVNTGPFPSAWRTVPRRWGSVSWVRGPDWLVATGDEAAAVAVHDALGGELLGAAATTPIPTASSAGCDSDIEGVVLPNCEPFSGATKYGSLSAAETGSGMKILSLPRPQDALADDDSVVDVWVAPRYHQVRIDYLSGLYVEFGGIGAKIADLSTADLVARYRLEAQQDAAGTGGQAREMAIGGVPTLVVPADSAEWANGASQHAGGSVEFILDHRSIAIAGHTSTSDLIEVASSMIGAA